MHRGHFPNQIAIQEILDDGLIRIVIEIAESDAHRVALRLFAIDLVVIPAENVGSI
jgi:hypothetical protein